MLLGLGLGLLIGNKGGVISRREKARAKATSPCSSCSCSSSSFFTNYWMVYWKKEGKLGENSSISQSTGIYLSEQGK